MTQLARRVHGFDTRLSRRRLRNVLEGRLLGNAAHSVLRLGEVGREGVRGVEAGSGNSAARSGGGDVVARSGWFEGVGEVCGGGGEGEGRGGVEGGGGGCGGLRHGEGV